MSPTSVITIQKLDIGIRPFVEENAVAKSRTSTMPKPGTKPDEIEVTYDLFDLPTAFHKAGLAGLVMLIDSLKKRRLLNRQDARYVLTPTQARVIFTESLVQQLMDDIYDARIVEVAVKTRWQGATVKREETTEETESGKFIKTKRYIYDIVQPLGQFLRDCYPDEDGLWLKLWRDMMWNIPRGRPTTREPYHQRANDKPCKEGANAWDQLLKVQKAREKNAFYTSEISSALLPGAQAVNAEGVPFEGRAEQNMLLHFWPLVVLLFVPQRIDHDGTTELPSSSFALAVPEVSNLQEFVHDYPVLLHQLNDGLPPDKTARGYRPARAVVDLPGEGALVLLDQLAALTKLKVETGELRFSIAGVDYLHLVKEGNNVKAMASGRVSPNKELLVGYRQIIAPQDESLRYRNPLFRRGLLVALLEDEPLWYRPFGYTFATFDADLFIRHLRGSNNGEEKGPPQFANDAAKKIRHETNLFTKYLERIKNMPEPERPKGQAPLPVIINRVVRSYLLTRSKEKTGINLEKFTTPTGEIDYKAIPAEFNETKQKLAQSLFLEFRSRKDQAFVDHFATTFFSVTQRLAEPDRLELADVLVNPDRRDDLKTLALLSLSANS
jgi:CRISPR-associated protein Cmx8